MRWYYFIRHPDDDSKFCPWNPTSHLPRPPDAKPDHGDPLTPWYEVSDHYDESHVHVRASSEEDAVRIAQRLLSKDPLFVGIRVEKMSFSLPVS